MPTITAAAALRQGLNRSKSQCTVLRYSIPYYGVNIKITHAYVA